MDWRVPVAVVIGLVLASLADWLFAGVLFHDRYQTYPEVWRFTGANPRALIAAQALTLPTVVGLITHPASPRPFPRYRAAPPSLRATSPRVA
jgi:hypothetical protein